MSIPVPDPAVLDAAALPAPPGPPGPPALALHGVSSGYGRTTVLREVSLTVPRSGAVALLGSNGAGKTTLLKTASGLIQPTRGRVEIGSTDVTRLPAHRRAALGLCHIPEGRGIFRRLTVRENLTMQAARGQEADAVARAAAAFPVLADRLNQQAGTLSGGQQQMLAMARAYVRDPELILVDEASLGLAPIVVEEIFRFLEQVVARGAALLLVDQFVTRALHLASWAYVLSRGEIVYAGPPAGLLDGDIFESYLGTT
jgi:branched-chain amino acid transport system ATP-binding protein